MHTTAFIIRHIFKLQEGTIFSTREFLSYGKRTAVDKCLSRLVKRDYITRLARGLFMKRNLSQPLPSVIVIATSKAKAFGKRIATHALDAAKHFGLTSQGNNSPTYFINGRSSSFSTGKERVYFKSAPAKKMYLGDSKAGLAIKALWSLGKNFCNAYSIDTVSIHFYRHDREEVRSLIPLMPAWLSNYFIH